MKIVIVEDDINMRKSLEIALADFDEFDILTYKNAIEALEKMPSDADLVITDLTMPKMDGMEFIRELGGKYDVIVITGNATLNKAITSMRLGVKDFITKPFEIDTLIQSIRQNAKLIEKSKQLKKQVKKDEQNVEFIAHSPALDKALLKAKKVSKTDASCMLLGQSGVGKELFAKYIHANSPRSLAPFVAINMAAIPENLLESELFGFEKGAFTDASKAKEGLFALANGGSLFLDEIGEMPMSLQAKLLRVLQEKEFMPLGGTKMIKLDLRYISATNANIDQKISQGEFREDLYYRLNTIPINIPPLRERKEEILPIAKHTLKRLCKEYGMDEKSFSKKAQEELLNYPWYGNIRELLSVVERALILSEEEEIQAEDLALKTHKEEKSIFEMEKQLLHEVLSQSDNDLNLASKTLGISVNTLKSKLNKYNLKEQI